MISISTPALLFPALSLLLLAYTNRFITLANLIRRLHDEFLQGKADHIWHQIKNLQLRINVIKSMQIFGVLSLFLCVLTMALIFFSFNNIADVIFALSLISMMMSLALSLRELFVSVDALNFQLSDLKEGCEDPDLE